jgi:glycosyltransferase involved in cell wall biosynthesis
VVNEAMACGLPALVSHAAGCAVDLIEEGATGYEFPVGDVSTLAERLSAVRRISPATLQSALARKLGIYSVRTCTENTLSAAGQMTMSGQRRETAGFMR